MMHSLRSLYLSLEDAEAALEHSPSDEAAVRVRELWVDVLPTLLVPYEEPNYALFEDARPFSLKEFKK